MDRISFYESEDKGSTPFAPMCKKLRVFCLRSSIGRSDGLRNSGHPLGRIESSNLSVGIVRIRRKLQLGSAPELESRSGL